jgi:phage/plasmid-like protein (TIGR03299 family)
VCKLAVQRPTTIEEMTHLDDEGRPARWVQNPDKQAITRSDTGHVMGIFSPGYLMHAYDEWLLNTVAKILYNDLSISSAGLLKNGAIAWVEVSVPETIHTPEGFDFRPNLLATTSFDGSTATTFKRTITAVVCDNTRAAALGETGQDYKVKHSRNSHARLDEARQALSVVHQLADDFTAEIRHQSRMDVTTRQWDTFLDLLIPSTDQKGHPLTGRAKTTAQDKKATIDHLYKHDPRAEPWTGTAPRSPAGSQHLRPPPLHRPRHHPTRAQHAPHRQGRLRRRRPFGLADTQSGASGLNPRPLPPSLG